MTRKKVTLAYITSDSERKASFKKRKKGLIKKISELCTLCDVQACVIIYSQYDREPEVWPSHLGAQAVISRLRKMSEMDQTRKMFNQDTFNRDRIRKVQEQLRRVQKENQRKECEFFLSRCLSGKAHVNEFNLANYPEMKQVIFQFLRGLQSKMEKSRISNNQGHQLVDSAALPPPLPLPPPPPLSPLPQLPPPDSITPPPVDQHHQFPSGSDGMALAPNITVPPLVNIQDNQFPFNFGSESAMVLSDPYVPAPPQSDMEAPLGGDENLESLLNLLESPAGGFIGSGLGRDEGMVLPYPYIFNSDILNPSTTNRSTPNAALVINTSIFNTSSSDVAPVLDSYTLDSSSDMAPVFNPSTLNSSRYDVGPVFSPSTFNHSGSGVSVFNLPTFNPSSSWAAPVFNPSTSYGASIFNPSTFGSSSFGIAPVFNPSTLNHSTSYGASVFDPSNFNPFNSGVASVFNPTSSHGASVFNPFTFDAAPVFNPSTSHGAPVSNPSIYESLFSGVEHLFNPSIFNPSTSHGAQVLDPSNFEPTTSYVASVINPSTSKPSTSDDAHGSDYN